MKTIKDFITNYIHQAFRLNPTASHSENGTTVRDLKDVLRTQVIAEQRFPNQSDWASWFNLSEGEKTSIITNARSEAAKSASQ